MRLKGEKVQQVTLNVDDEIKALGDALATLISDIKAKKSVAQIASDLLPGLMAAVSGYQNIGGDLKKVDDQTFLVHALSKALQGQ